MLDLTADQIRLLLILTADAWHGWEKYKGFGDQRAATRQVELEGIQEKLREALDRSTAIVPGFVAQPKKPNPIYKGKQ